MSQKSIYLLLSLLNIYLAGGLWSAHGQGISGTVVQCGQRSHSLADFDSGKTVETAPNGSNRIVLASDGSFQIMRGEKQISVIHLPNVSSNIEIQWAPDSEKFSITYSNGGGEGQFQAHIYRLGRDSVEEVSEAVKSASTDFQGKHYCKARGNNVYVEGWTADSERVLITTEVYPTGDCGKEFGRLGGYLVDLAGRIVQQYGNRSVSKMRVACEKRGRIVLP